MLINRIHIDQVALARSLASRFPARENVLARLPGRPIHRGPPSNGGRLVHLLRGLRIGLLIDRGKFTIHVKTKYRDRARSVRHAKKPGISA
jgi:hypothetical protein